MPRHPNDEIELKLDLGQVADTFDWPAFFGGAPTRIAQRSIYFDTPDRVLADAGLSLRIRDDGARRVQTVKERRAGAGLFHRSEWEFEVEDDRPRVDARTPALERLGLPGSAFQPILTVETHRALWMLGGVEVALDHAVVRAGERRIAFSELELEAKGCEPAALFALARRIGAVAPVDIGVLSKAERGYLLLAGAVGAAKADRTILSPAATAGAAFQQIVRGCLRHLRRNMPLVIDAADAEALHQARVALRRLRSALSIYRPILPRGAVRRWKVELRWLAGALSRARSIDVLPRPPAGSPADAVIARARAAAYAEARAALSSARGRGLLFDLLEWVTLGDWLDDPAAASDRDRPARAFAAERLDHLRRRLKRKGRHFDGADDRALHATRKAAKMLRYAVDFHQSLFGSDRDRRRLERFADDLSVLQDALGVLNDRVAAPALLRELGVEDMASACDPTSGASRAALRRAARRAFDALMHDKPFW